MQKPGVAKQRLQSCKEISGPPLVLLEENSCHCYEPLHGAAYLCKQVLSLVFQKAELYSFAFRMA
jgi:hypothetical protein